MKFLDEKAFDRTYIKKNLLPDAIKSSILYGFISVLLGSFIVILLSDLIIDWSEYNAVSLGISVFGQLGLIFVLLPFLKYEIEYFKKIRCLQTGDYKVYGSVVEQMVNKEGRFFGTGPYLKASDFVFRAKDGDTMRLPQGHFRKSVITIGQPAWLISFGSKKSFAMDFVLEPDMSKE